MESPTTELLLVSDVYDTSKEDGLLGRIKWIPSIGKYFLEVGDYVSPHLDTKEEAVNLLLVKLNETNLTVEKEV